MRCLGFLKDDVVSEEVGHYGDVGGVPQVVWANGVLASTAVGLAVDLLSDWTKTANQTVFLSYRGNEGTVMPDPRAILLTVDHVCPHYSRKDVGDAF